VVIIGAARQGLALAAFLAKRNAQVVINDHRKPQDLESSQKQFTDQVGEQASVEWVLGDHP